MIQHCVKLLLTTKQAYMSAKINKKAYRQKRLGKTKDKRTIIHHSTITH